MNIILIIETAIIVLFALFFIWWIIRNGLKATAIQLIVYAENTNLIGSEKMDLCIEKMIKFIPFPFRLFITRNMVKKLIQAVFDQIKIALNYQSEKNKIIESEEEEDEYYKNDHPYKQNNIS